VKKKQGVQGQGS